MTDGIDNEAHIQGDNLFNTKKIEWTKKYQYNKVTDRQVHHIIQMLPISGVGYHWIFIPAMAHSIFDLVLLDLPWLSIMHVANRLN